MHIDPNLNTVNGSRTGHIERRRYNAQVRALHHNRRSEDVKQAYHPLNLVAVQIVADRTNMHERTTQNMDGTQAYALAVTRNVPRLPKGTFLKEVG